MDRPIAIKRLKRILEVKNENLDMYDKEALKMALASLETDETYQLEYEPTTKNDLTLIHTEGLDEEIRCTMCTNSMKSDRGCDGSCVVNNAMYKNVMDAIEKRIQPTTKNDLGVDCISRQAAIDAIRRIHPIDTDYDCTLFDKVDVMYVLNDLPSVTPQEPRWIPVSERLPKELWGVLVYCPTNDNVFCAYLEKGVWKIFSPEALEEIKEIVTAWMPLPKAYSEVEE